MLRHADYTRDRVQQLVERLKGKIYRQTRWVDVLDVAGPVDRISYEQAQALNEFRPARPGDQFGPAWATYWFRGRVVVPDDWRGSRVDLLWDTQSEATLWLDGRSVQGLNVNQGDRPDAILLDHAQGGETLSFQIEMACNNKFGISTGGGQNASLGLLSPWHLRRCEIARFDPRAWDLYHDAVNLADLLIDLMQGTDTGDKSWEGLLLSELNRFCNTIHVDDESTWPAAQAILRELYQHHNGTRQFELSAIGHAHIDTAWLWPLAETWRKCERTFSTATTYMRDYPEYRFACSQAYQYDIIRQRNPDLYQRIKSRIAGGQWVVVGGTWIEPDCNIPSGEALCRQFLFGQRYFQREFGIRCREFWNPDVFGYNGQLPQIMNQAGIKRFLTQKLSWNRFNRPHHHTFTWQGIDGSEVIAHFPPADNYNAFMHMPGYNHLTWLRVNARRFKDHDRAHHGMMLYGWGDGGGGPTKPMLETLRRVHDLQSVPRTKQRTSDEFFDLLEQDIIDRPLQVGELYFEYHRGTYTTQALVKKNNRRTEQLLHDLEFLATLVGPGRYPREPINEIWKTLLLNQFHDILPGSSIREVYEDSATQFAQAIENGERLIADLAGAGDTPVNTTSFSRTDVLERGGQLVTVHAAPYAAARVVENDDTAAIEESGDGFILSNRYLLATFNHGGRLLSLIFRHTGRETLAGEANVFELFDDRPTQYDAWDVDPFHMETARPAPAAHRTTVVRSDRLRVELRFEQQLTPRSTLVQTVRLDAGSPRLEFHCEIDWQEEATMLKVAYPVNVRAMNATYEMQFGNVERPTHYNTPYDLAKFEVPFHKWFDLSEHGFGCAILTDCKYGGSTFGQTMRLSLLRAPLSPDATADRGRHTFAYALYPHAFGWREGHVVAEAAKFNAPLRHVAAAPAEPFAQVDDPNLVIDTIKRAEDSDAVILRLYECHGARGMARLKLSGAYTKASLCNVLEDEGKFVEIADGLIELPYTPYKLISLKLT